MTGYRRFLHYAAVSPCTLPSKQLKNPKRLLQVLSLQNLGEKSFPWAMPYGYISSFRLLPEVARFIIAEQCEPFVFFLLFLSLVAEHLRLSSCSFVFPAIFTWPQRESTKAVRHST